MYSFLLKQQQQQKKKLTDPKGLSGWRSQKRGNFRERASQITF